MPSNNEITGDSICTKFSKTFAEGWDRIFNKTINVSKPYLAKNAGKCLSCGEIVESKFRWDYSTCKCGNLSVDGGHDYARVILGDSSAYEDLCIYTTDIAEIREYFTWKSYGKSGEFPEGIVRKLKDLTNPHIQAILETQWHIKGSSTEEILLAELQYRKMKGIQIEE